MSGVRRTLTAVLTLTAAVQQIPPDHRGGYELASDHVVVEAPEYAEALEAANRQVPEGWRIISLRVDRE